MAYELRIPGRPPSRYETEPEAVEAARAAIQDDADLEPDLIDLSTGQPCTPAGSASWREHLRRTVGF